MLKVPLSLLLVLSLRVDGLQIDGDTVWVVAGEMDGQAVFGDSLEPPAYSMALRDLQADWYKVFGFSPSIHKLADATKLATSKAPTSKRSFTEAADQFCNGNYHPNTTCQATIKQCQAKCDEIGCWCFDHNPEDTTATCRLAIGDASTSKSSNNLSAWTWDQAPPPAPPPPPPPAPLPSIPEGGVFFGTLEHMPQLSEQFDLSECELWRGAEAHCVVVRNGSLIATGNGTRGAIFALYTVAEKLLGVDPWYHFSQQPAPFLGQLTVDDSLAIVIPPPVFQYRGIFNNDEDLLGYFRPDPLGEGLYDLYTANQIYETVLRNKANMIIPGTSTNPDERHIALAAKRGLAIHHSHFEIAGFGPFMWLDGDAAPRNSYNWSQHPDLMAHTWKAAIHAQKDYEVVWTVGLRGLWDVSYCGGEGTRRCGDAISTAMANQTRWIREVQPDAHIVTYLWDEGLAMFEGGYIRVPDGVRVLFTDSGSGYIDGSNFSLAHGVYYHTAMLDGGANQISEMIPPSRIFEQFTAFVKGCKETFLLVDNVSDLWPVLLSTEAVLKFAWDPVQFSGNSSVEEMRFFEAFAARNFGVALSGAVAAVYKQYFSIPHIVTGHSDEMFGSMLRELGGAGASDLASGHGISNATLVAAQTGLATITPSLAPCAAAKAAADALVGSVSAANLQFFTAHVVYQTSLQHFASQAIANLARSLIALAGNNATDAIRLSNQSMEALSDLFAAQRRAEGTGQWQGLFSMDRLPYTALQGSRRVVRKYHRLLLDPTTVVFEGYSPSGYYSFYDYQKLAIDNFPLQFPSADYKANDFVLMNCTAGCRNGPNGGVFTESETTVNMWTTRCRNHDEFLPVINCAAEGLFVRYSTDGRAPTSASPQYTGPIVLNGTTQLSAVIETNGRLHQLIHQALFTKLK